MSAIGDFSRKITSKLLAFSLSTIGKGIARLILSTCKWEVKGLENFHDAAKKNRCILMLWHNRLAITSFILYRYARNFKYAAVISNSRDGELIGSLVRSYKNGSTIKVAHDSRQEALRALIRHLQKKEEVVVITPDGPRGPLYKAKPGIALAAMMAAAQVVPLDWQADRCWELKTWDKLRFPKPFTTIRVSFGQALYFDRNKTVSDIQDQLQNALYFIK